MVVSYNDIKITPMTLLLYHHYRISTGIFPQGTGYEPSWYLRIQSQQC